jgi:hypothetical protein
VVSQSDSTKVDGDVEKLGLALCGVSSFVEDIVTTLTDEVSFVEVKARLEPSDDLDADFQRSGADLLLCALPEHDMDRLWRGALARRPPLAVLNLLHDHSSGRMYAVYPHGHSVEEVNGGTLLDELRHALSALRALPR